MCGFRSAVTSLIRQSCSEIRVAGRKKRCSAAVVADLVISLFLWMQHAFLLVCGPDYDKREKGKQNCERMKKMLRLRNSCHLKKQ